MPPENENPTDPRPPRFTELERALRYPPIFLLLLTAIVLLLAMGTARADESAAESFEQATERLSEGSFEDFERLFPGSGSLVVSESWGLEGDDPEVYRQVFQAPLDEEAWSLDIRPLTDLIGLESGALVTCAEEGGCEVVGDGFHLRLVFGVELGATKLRALEVWHDASLGC